ncbi:Hypothetical protein PHPALM_16785 [Phytophthora palmivora]|uniref:HAT C-terminal dimerisation domain-containing protein n=1 Tax=Phytophthora palmivora TaxID=4796 RepID=A0A2P4XP36_9STRA|nr:Hypothetical protein PHPALM_16785 [Phytophthora palmivora]
MFKYGGGYVWLVMRATENVHFCNFTVKFTKLYRPKRYFNQRESGVDEQVNRILASALCREDTKLLSLLLETIRIIFNNLPFRFGEYEESIIIRELVSKEEFKTAVNVRNVTHALVELYTAARNEMTGCIKDNRVGMFKCLTMVVVPKFNTKNIWAFVYALLTPSFRYRSVLLGTRHFSPLYGERDQGIRQPFEMWLRSILGDFGLNPSDFFGSTTDSGPDVKWVMRNGLGLRWEWCIPHMVNASTKMACGLTRKPFNPAMTDLLNKMSQTVYDTVSNSTMGDLLPVLMIMLGQGSSTKLVCYKPHRFMALEAWYQERAAKAVRNRKVPQGFPLADCYQHFVQLLSILMPIILANKRAQAEDSNQVQALLSLYTVRMTALALDQPIRRYDTPPTKPVYIQTYQLTSAVSTTPKLLQKVFYNPEYISSGSYTIEMQLMLHPGVNHVGGPMDEVVEAIARTEDKIIDARISNHVSKIRTVVIKSLKALMRLVARGNDAAEPPEETAIAAQNEIFDDDIMAAFAVRRQSISHSVQRHHNPHDISIDRELKKWLSDRNGLVMTSGKTIKGKEIKPKPESILQFWHRQYEKKELRFVTPSGPNFPASSAQIERDFGNSGQLVTALRASKSLQNIDMACFLHQNRSFVDICQCLKLSAAEIEENLPTNVKINLEPETIERMDWGQMQQDIFSTSSISAFASDDDESKDN